MFILRKIFCISLFLFGIVIFIKIILNEKEKSSVLSINEVSNYFATYNVEFISSITNFNGIKLFQWDPVYICSFETEQKNICAYIKKYDFVEVPGFSKDTMSFVPDKLKSKFLKNKHNSLFENISLLPARIIISYHIRSGIAYVNICVITI